MPRFQTDKAMLAAPFLFVLLWSSSFVTAKIGLRHLSPLLFVAIRLTACAVVLTVLMVTLRRSWRPLAGRKWMHCAIAPGKQPTFFQGRSRIVPRRARLPSLPQQIERLRRQHDVTVLAPLACSMRMIFCAPAQAAAIAETEQHAHLEAARDREQANPIIKDAS